MSETHHTVTVLIALLLVSSGVAMATKWLRVPYTLLLVLVGLFISPMHFLPTVHISPDLILLVFLPALLFEAAWNLRLDHLRQNLVPILTLAIAGVVLSVGVVGGIIHLAVGLPLSTSMLFGAVISATDPVSVLAIFKKLNLPTRLSTIVEGESLFNDGTAVVVFRIILGVVIGVVPDSTLALTLGSLREFVVVVFGGVVVGAVVGIVASTLTSRFEDYLLEITLTTIAAYGSFVAAEQLHVSPVIAVLIAGLVIGNHGRRTGMSATTQVAVNAFWEYAAFVVNSLVFLLIGMEVQLGALVGDIEAIIWAIVAMLAGRTVAVYGLAPVLGIMRQAVPFRWQHVLAWGGLRGSLSIALVLSIPSSVPGRPLLVSMVFGAVLFSLLVQGLTMSRLLRVLGFSQAESRVVEYEILQSQLMADTAAIAEIERLRSEGTVTDRLYQEIKQPIDESREALATKLSEFGKDVRMLEREQLRRLEARLGDVRKARIAELWREGLLSDQGYEVLIRDFDEQFGRSPDEEQSETASSPGV